MLKLRMDWTDWTLKELGAFIAYTGKHPQEWFQSAVGAEAAALDARLLVGLAWIALRLDDPTLTIDTVADTVTSAEVYAALAAIGDSDTPEEEPAPPTKRPRTPKS